MIIELNKVFEKERKNLHRYACYKLGNAEDAEDILHDCYLKLYRRFSTQQESKVTDMKSYVFRSLSNMCSSRLSEVLKIERVPLENVDAAEVPSNSHDEEYLRIIKLLKEIPKEQAEVISLRMYGNRSFAEISDILQVPLPTVKSRFLYGLKKLRTAIK